MEVSSHKANIPDNIETEFDTNTASNVAQQEKDPTHALPTDVYHFLLELLNSHAPKKLPMIFRLTKPQCATKFNDPSTGIKIRNTAALNKIYTEVSVL